MDVVANIAYLTYAGYVVVLANEFTFLFLKRIEKVVPFLIWNLKVQRMNLVANIAHLTKAGDVALANKCIILLKFLICCGTCFTSFDFDRCPRIRFVYRTMILSK